MRRILVAIDGSDIAMRALDFAVAQAGMVPQARLHVLMVEPPIAVYGEAAAYTTESAVRAEAVEDCRAILESARSRIRGAVPTPELEVLQGDPAETIVRRARELECESIVMGTHGRGRLGEALLGSVAHQVVHTSHVPVTLLR